MKTPIKYIPVSIACATNAELLKMFQKETYTEYWKACIQEEILKRNLIPTSE